jgi:hypothetical protein
MHEQVNQASARCRHVKKANRKEVKKKTSVVRGKRNSKKEKKQLPQY